MDVNDPYLNAERGTHREITNSMVARAEVKKQADSAFRYLGVLGQPRGYWGFMGLGGLAGQAAAGAPIRPDRLGPCPYCGR